MFFIQITILGFVAVVGTAVVLTRRPENQVIGLSFYGLLLALMFFVFQAPDVALSQIVVGAVALPLMLMLSMAKIRQNREQREQRERKGTPEHPKAGGRETEAA